MVMSEEGQNQLNKKLIELCSKLNLDLKTTTTAWDNFRSINKNFVLEGDALHWLGCAVFVTSQSVETPTVLSSSVVRGNGINLTSLLRHSNLSFIQFFANISKWSEMAHLPEEFNKKISYLKDTFGVAHNAFKEYYPIFSKIFFPPSAQDLDQKNHRNRKQRPTSCNSSKVFEFVWNLFITLKTEDSQYGTELIKSYHLLYACLDLAFKNAFLADRRDLLNPSFEGLPRDWMDSSYEVSSEAPCIIGLLCKSPSMLTEAMHMKMYVAKAMIGNMVRNKTLLMDPVTHTGIFDRDVFDQNMRNLTNSYETHLLNKVDIDERIFLAEYRRQLLEQHNLNTSVIKVMPNENSALDSPRIVVPRGSDTPLTGRGLLGPREADTPYSVDRTTSQKITRLHTILNNRSPNPSESLLQLFESCKTDPLIKIQDILQNMGEQFVTAYIDFRTQDEEYEARNQLQIGITLFYKFVENILQNEKSIVDDISVLVVKDIFYQCTFACCMEIVLFSYSSSNKFPWILDVLGLQAIHFVKVIELIVRSKEPMSREMIKHLSRIEETVLESLAWKSESHLWQTIEMSDQDIPKFEDTALPGHLLYNNNSNKKIQNPEVSSSTSSDQSPSPSAMDCFQSPIAGNVTRQLFPTVQPGQSVLQRHTHIMITDKDGNRKLIPIIDSERQNSQNIQNCISDNVPTQPKRTGSLSIFFRKFYNLAGVRMEHLCSKLGLVDSDLKSRIWTVFEKSVRESDLIKDRHLDQLLMCAIYMICRIQRLSVMFQDIMKFYREQPQCTSKVYRDVLFSRQKIDEDGTVASEERSDLISFYNAVYVDVMQKFVKSRSSVQSNLLLSPFPDIKRQLVSPSVQVVGNVFVRPLGSPSTTPKASYNYFFSRSPSKDLKDINKLVNKSITGKRLLEGDLDIPAKQRISNRKFQSLVEERRSQNTE